MLSQLTTKGLAAGALLAVLAASATAANPILHDVGGHDVSIPLPNRPLTVVLFLRIDANAATSTTARGDLTLLQSSLRQQPKALGSVVVAALGRGATARDALNATYNWRLGARTPLVVDNRERLATSWHVTRVPTLLLLRSNGRVVKRWTTRISPGALASAIAAALPVNR